MNVNPLEYKLDVPTLKSLLVETATRWSADKVSRLSAAIAFFAVLSLSPLLVFTVTIASALMGDESVRTRILREVRTSMGPQTATFFGSLISHPAGPGVDFIAGTLSLLLVLFGASNLFLNLEDTVNDIWHIPAAKHAIKGFILNRVLSVGTALVFSVVVFAWVATDSWLGWVVKHAGVHHAWRVSRIAFSFLFMLGVCAYAYKSLPRDMVAWRDVWLGATVSALGFVVTKFLLSLYFAYSNFSNVYGSAGALVVVLLWTFYMTQIFLFGLEFTCVYAHRYGSHSNRS